MSDNWSLKDNGETVVNWEWNVSGWKKDSINTLRTKILKDVRDLCYKHTYTRWNDKLYQDFVKIINKRFGIE